MYHQRNPAFCNHQGSTRLRVLDCGTAHFTTTEWTATIVSPGYSRLYYILGGDPFIRFDGVEYPLLPGNCYLLPTGFSFEHSCKERMEQIYFHVNLQNETGYDLLRSCPTPLRLDCDASFCIKLAEHLEKCDPIAALLTEGMLLETLGKLFMKYGFFPEQTPLSPCVQAAVTCINEHPSIQLTLPILAEQLFVSSSTLAKKFRAEIGKPLGGYIDDIVFFEAEQLLRRSELSIFEISTQLGFCDQFYFSRRFKEKYGTTPQKYRKTRII